MLCKLFPSIQSKRVLQALMLVARNAGSLEAKDCR